MASASMCFAEVSYADIGGHCHLELPAILIQPVGLLLRALYLSPHPLRFSQPHSATMLLAFFNRKALPPNSVVPERHN